MNKLKITYFLILCFVLNGILALVFYLTGEKWGVSPISQFVGVIYMYIPFISVLIVQKIIYKGNIKHSIGFYFRFNRWYFYAWFLPFLISILVFLISLSMPNVSLSFNLQGFFERYEKYFQKQQIDLMRMQFEKYGNILFFMTLIQSLIAGITINAIFAFGEESGWRGFLLSEMKNLGFWKSSLIIGFIWGLWHSPIIAMGHNYPQHPKIGIIMMIIFCILYSPIFIYTRIKTKSVIGPSILHGSLNATGGLTIMFLKGGNDITIGITGISGFIVLLITNIFIFFDKTIKNKKIEQLLEI